MYKDKPSNTARKVALNIVTLGAKPGMDGILPAGIVNATADLLVASGVVSATAVRWSRSPRMVWVYEAFDGMMKGQCHLLRGSSRAAWIPKNPTKRWLDR